MLQKTVTEYSYNSNITVTKKINITMTNIIDQHKKRQQYIWLKDNEQITTLNPGAYRGGGGSMGAVDPLFEKSALFEKKIK